MSNTNSNKRELWIDMMKGWGLLLILIAHSGGIPFVGNWATAYYIQMFFILAGYTLHIDNVKTFLVNRAKRLLFPYLMYSFVTVLIVTCEQYVLHTLTTKQFFLNVFGVLYSRYCLFPYGKEDNIYFLKCANSPLWFLTAMFVAYIFVLLFYKVNKSYRVGMILLYFCMTIILENLPILLPWSIDTALVLALFVISGAELKRYILLIEKRWQHILIFTISILVYFPLCIINGDINLSVGIYGAYRIISIFGCFMIGILGTYIFSKIFKLFGKVKYIANGLAYLGRNTLTLLCTYFLVYRYVEKVCAMANISGRTIQIIQICFAIFALIILIKIKEHYLQKFEWIRFV